MSGREYKTEEEARNAVKIMEEQTGYNFGCFNDGLVWVVYQEEGGVYDE